MVTTSTSRGPDTDRASTDSASADVASSENHSTSAPVSASIRAAADSRLSSSRAAMITVAPSAASSRAVS